MATEKVVPTKHELEGFDLANPEIVELIHRAQESDAADRLLTIRQALKKYKKAVFWAMFLSTSLIMEGYDLVIINSFYGQSQFQNRFGVYDPGSGQKLIPASWQSGLSNSALVGQLFGLLVNAYAQDRFGCRPTMMFFMTWMAVMVFIPVFAPSLSILAWGEAMCGVSWGVFQTLSTTYASEVVPTVLRPYVTAYVCMCWGAGILLSSGVVRAVAGVQGDLGWRLPFVLQWIWPIPLFIGAYLAPESPWNAVRRGKIDLARTSLMRLHQDTPDKEQEVDATLAYIKHTTALEKEETANASFIQCFQGSNLRRTEINCVVWAAQILCGNALLGYSVVFLEAAGFSQIQAFDVNISLSACYIIGGIICWFLFPHVGRATIYMGGLTFMFFCLVAIGGLGWAHGSGAQLAIAILFVISTLCNMISVGPACYPIVAETPSGRLRYKTIVIGRSVYNLTGIFSNIVTPRMISSLSWNWGAKAGLFYAGTNLLCNIWCWFRLPETKDRTFGEIDLLFDNHIPAREFKYTKVDHTSDSPGVTARDEATSKYFARSKKKAEVIKVEASESTTASISIEQFILELSSDSSLSDVPSDFSSREKDEKAVHISSTTSVSSTKQPPTKPVRKKPVKISPYFPKLASEAVESCLPFPPISADSFGLIQEQLAHEPFRLLLATIFLNRTRGGVAIPILFNLVQRYPSIEAMANADLTAVVAKIHCLGFQNQRAKKCIEMAQKWLESPPAYGKRYRKLHYPKKKDGRDVGASECIDDDDPRIAWEIAHLPGVGAYAIDSWRIFCRDELRGLASDWKGTGSDKSDFEPEWKRVLPMDKELRAYLTWMWLKEGWVWDRETGKRIRAPGEVMRAAAKGGLAHEEQDGNWALELSPQKAGFSLEYPS